MAGKAKIAFGSFHFQVTKAAPRTFTGGDYLDWIDSALGAIATVTDIAISARPSYRNNEFERPSEEDLRLLTQLKYNVPSLQFVSISFKVHVPKRYQDELSELGLRIDPNLGEDFVVTISDGWQSSLVMIRPLADTVTAPTDAVMVIREFLEREFERLGDRPVSFQCLGPSPAHLRVVLSPSQAESISDDFERIAHQRRGYDHYEFRCRDDFESDDAMCTAFFWRVKGELDILYRMAVARGRQLDLWGDAVGETMSILDAYKRRGIRGWLARMWQGRKLRAALISLGEIELRQQDDKQQFDRAVVAAYDVGSGLMPEVIRDDLEELEPRPIAPLSSLLQLLEASRHTGRDVLLASVASLIGAAVAAAATLIAA